MSELDWTIVDANGYPEDTVTCRCDAVFRSHAKYVLGRGLLSRKPCPNCGSTAIRKASGDPEVMTIRGRKQT